MFSDPIFVTCVVGVTVNGAGVAACVYLWNDDPRERYLLFWATAFLFSLVRWIVHYSAESAYAFRVLESILACGTVGSIMLGAYSLLPDKPWRIRSFAWCVAGIAMVYFVSSTLMQRVIEFGYGLAIAATLFSVWCFWKTYWATRISGYAISAVGLLFWAAMSVMLLSMFGKEMGNVALVPLIWIFPLSGFLLVAYQRAIRRSRLAEQTMQAVFNTVPIPVAITRPPHGEIELANEAALRAVNLTKESMYGKTIMETGISFDALARQAMYDELASGGVVTDREVAVRLDSTEKRIFSINARRLNLEDGPRYVFAYYDLTERHRAAEDLRALNVSLESRVRERTAELEIANRELEAFSYSVSHDLRAPLRAVEGFVRVLLGESDGASHKRAQERILAAVKRMNSLIEDLIGLARVSRQEIVRQPVALDVLAREIIDSLRERDQDRSVMVRVDPTPVIGCDRALMNIVLENLLGNAWKFTGKRADARIEFGAQVSPDGKVAYFVTDNGAGFDPEYTQRLFTPFQRLHGQQEFEGSGIGLAIVKRIVERHGGRVWAESAPGCGATFRFSLPPG